MHVTGKKSWPELVGVSGEIAAAKIAYATYHCHRKTTVPQQ